MSLLTSHFHWLNPAHASVFHFLEIKPFPLIKENHQLASFSKLGRGDARRRAGQTEIYGILTYATNVA